MSRISRFTDLGNKINDPEDMKDVCKAWEESGLSQREFARNHSIHPASMNRYAQKWKILKEGGPDLFRASVCGGRPPLVDTTRIVNMRAKISENTDGKAQNNTVRGFKAMALQAIAETQESRGEAAQNVTISKSSLQRLRNDPILETTHVQKGQTKTVARIRAEGDPRNFFTFACVCIALILKAGLLAHLIMNWDATTFIIDEDGKLDVIKLKSEADTKVATLEKKSGLNFGCKWYYVHSAAGKVGWPVYVFADDSMEENEFDVYEIPGLGFNQQVTKMDLNLGYVVFTKTRNCCADFYRWFALNIIIPFVESLSTTEGNNEFVDSEGNPLPILIACDGEYIQISAFQDPDIRDQLKLLRITLIKSPASLSAKTQAADAGNMFKASKTKLSFAQPDDWDDPLLRRRLLEKVFNFRLTWKQEKKVKHAEGLLRVRYAIMSVMDTKIVREGFFNIRMFPVNPKKIMGSCTSKMTPQQLNEFVDKMGRGADEILDKGHIKDRLMDEWGLMRIEGDTKCREDGALQHMRAVWMNHEDVVDLFTLQRARALARQEVAATNRDPVIVGLRAQEKEARAAEKRRRAGMTEEEKKAEAAAKRRATNAARKAAKQVAMVHEREAARQPPPAVPIAAAPADIPADEDPDVDENDNNEENLDDSMAESDYF